LLYQWYEAQHSAWAPLRLLAGSSQAWLTGLPATFADTPFARAISASAELFERTTRRWERPSWGLDHTFVDGRKVAVRTSSAWERPFCTLTHFERAVDPGRNDPRVLVVAPMSGHFATLLRGTVEALLPEHDVYITEWQNARDVPVTEGTFDLDDYVEYVIDMIRLLGPDVHVIGVCQPVVPVLAAVSLLAAQDDPAQPLTMTLMAGPLDGRQNPTAVNEFATSHPIEWFERHLTTPVPGYYPGSGRTVYPGFVQLTAFMSMNADRHWQAHQRLYDDVVAGNEDAADRHRTFYDEYYAVMDMPAEYYLQTVDRVFQRYEIARGEFSWRGQPVDPGAISRTALMTVEGERDDISGLGQTRVAHDLCSGLGPEMREHHEQPGVGHYGVFSGTRWRNETMPRIATFIRQHRARAAAATAAAASGAPEEPATLQA
jgi:poly(3-hydroxybutyrate) depolymerase